MLKKLKQKWHKVSKAVVNFLTKKRTVASVKKALGKAWKKLKAINKRTVLKALLVVLVTGGFVLQHRTNSAKLAKAQSSLQQALYQGYYTGCGQTFVGLDNIVRSKFKSPAGFGFTGAQVQQICQQQSFRFVIMYLMSAGGADETLETPTK